MSALFKSSMLLLPATAIAATVYAVLGDRGFDLARPRQPDEICKQDEERLARLRASPSLDEGLRFEGEIRCLRLWPQLQTILDGLGNPSQSTGVSDPNRADPDPRTGSDARPATAAPGPTSAALDDACTRDDERLTALEAAPSVDEAVRFAGELKCLRLQPRMHALLDSLGQAPQAAGASSPGGAPPGTTSMVGAPPPNPTSGGETAPPASASPTVDAASGLLDDACKRDEDRLDRLRQNLSIEETARFADELSCERLRPQLLALVGASPKPPQPGEGDASRDAAPATTNMTNDAPPASDSDRRIAALERERDALAAKVDELERHRETPPEQVAAPPPQRPALAVDRSDSDHASQAIVDAERRIAALESEQEALAAKVSTLQRDRTAPSAEPATSPPSQKPAAPAEPSENQAASQAAGERNALGPEVERLGRDQDSAPEQVASLPPPRALAASPNPTPAISPVGQPNLDATGSNFDPGPNLASLPDGMAPRVLIRYPRNNADARRRAEGVADALTKQGLEVADVRESDGVMLTELRFFYAPDAAMAQRIGGLLGIAPTRRPQPKDGLMARPGAIELSLSADSHLAVVDTSRKESVHE